MQLPHLSLPHLSLDSAASAIRTVSLPLSSLTTALSGFPLDASTVIAGGANATQSAARTLALANGPIAVTARTTQISALQRTAGFLGRTIPVVVVGASALQGARIVNEQGAGALVHTKAGRGAVLGVAGGTLLLIPTPATQLGGAAMLTASAVNELGGFKRLDGATAGAAALAH